MPRRPLRERLAHGIGLFCLRTSRVVVPGAGFTAIGSLVAFGAGSRYIPEHETWFTVCALMSAGGIVYGIITQSVAEWAKRYLMRCEFRRRHGTGQLTA